MPNLMDVFIGTMTIIGLGTDSSPPAPNDNSVEDSEACRLAHGREALTQRNNS